MTEEVPWPALPREPGQWASRTPVAPAGNTALPPLPGPGGVSRPVSSNPFATGTPAQPGVAGQPFPGIANVAMGAVAPVDRAPRWLVAVAALVVLAMVAGGAYVVLRGGRQFPSSWDPRVEPIAKWVASERHLDFDHPVEVQFLSAEEYSQASTDGEAGEGGDGVEDIGEEAAAANDDLVAQFRALGLVAGKIDLDAAGDTLSDSATLAYYDPASKKVYVRGTEVTPALRVTLAHELTHVLQDQHFDLERLRDLSEGQATTLRALAEGDAGRIEDSYVDDVLTAEERTAHEEESQTSSDEATESLDEVPPVFTALFGAPYVLGPELVDHLIATGGNRAIDDALADPPGEEVLFDPTAFGTDAVGDEPLEVSAPAGAEVLEQGEFGPTAWYLVLASRMEPGVALKAANGLAGDGYAVYREDDRVCVTAEVGADTDTDLMELSGALGDWVAKSPPDTASVDADGNQVTFRSCDPGAEAGAVGAITPDMLQLPVLRTELYREITEQGESSELATCVVDGVLDRVSFEQIKAGFLNSPPATKVGAEVASSCR